jgi:long-chain acyl-CoA synthetase
MRTSVAEYLADFERFGREPAYSERIGYRLCRWTYAEIAQTAYRFARELNARQIRKGDRVLLWGPNSPLWVAAFFGCANRGVIVVPLDDAAAPDFALRVFQQVNAQLLVCSREHAQAGAASIFLEDLQNSLARHSPAALDPEKIGPHEPLQIVFTSGTTAEPKGVVITHSNVLANVTPLEEQIRPYLKYERYVHPIRFLNLLPLSHVFGQFLGMYLPPLLRGTVFFQETLKPPDVMHSIRRQHISVLVAVPKRSNAIWRTRAGWKPFAAVSNLPAADTFCDAGGCFGVSTANLVGNSGHSSAEAQLSTRRLRSSGVDSVLPSFRVTGSQRQPR